MIYLDIGWDGLLRQDTSQHQNSYIVRDLYYLRVLSHASSSGASSIDLEPIWS